MEKIAYIIYLTVLLLSILMFGAMHTYMYTFMSLGVLLASFLIVLKRIDKDYKTGTYGLRLPRSGLHGVFVVLLGFLALQVIPLPGSILRVLSPEAWVAWQKSWPAVQTVGDGVVGTHWFSIASYPYPVRMSMVRFVVYGLFFFGFLQTLRTRHRINVDIAVLLAMGCFEALYGLFQTYSESGSILWIKRLAYRKDVRGTYINRNHFAGFMGMGLLCAAAFTAALSSGKKRPSGKKKTKRSWRSRLSDVLSSDDTLSKRLLVLFSGVVLGIGLIFSASRDGMVSAAGGLLLLGIMLSIKAGFRRKGLVILCLFGLIAAYAVKIGVDYPLKRFESFYSSMEDRERYAERTLDVYGDYPWVGVGAGNFQYVYPRYQAEKDKKRYVRFAHNDWAQYLAEAGILGMVLLLGGIGYYVYRVVRLWRRRTDPYAVCLGILPLVVLAYMAVHSYSDFNLHIPANFLVLAAIMAIGYAALHLERHHRHDRMAYRYYRLPLKSVKGAGVLVLILRVMGWTGWWSIRHFMAEAYCNTVPNSTLNRDPKPPVGEVVEAIEWDDSNAEYWFKFAEGMEQSEKSLTQSRKGAKEEIGGNRRNLRISALEKSVELNPFDAVYHLRLGWAYAHEWKRPDYHDKWLPAADICMDRAAYFAGVKNPHLHQELGNYWVMRSKSVYPNNPVHHEAWAKACWHYRKAQSAERGAQGGEQGAGGRELKGMKKEIHDYVWNYYPDEAYVDQVVADHAKTPDT